jgi:hypothetical protein
MLDEAKMLNDRIDFYKRDIDNPFSVNGFRGTWQFSDHGLIPSILHGFLTRYFGIAKLKRVPLDEINKLMNEVWEGPGSLEKLFRLEAEMIAAGQTIKFDSRDFEKPKEKEEAEEDEFDIPLSVFGSDEFLDEEDDEDEDR